MIPSASKLNLAVSRLNTERIYSKEKMLVGELDGRLVGKINTNAAAFTRIQIGGVYVHPDYRGCGIARRMTGEFTSNLMMSPKNVQNKTDCPWSGVSLFVKKSNVKARNVYEHIGFKAAGDYRICYF